jgi:outer membrane protein OmpA-like peptidoglycan-associated protein
MRARDDMGGFCIRNQMFRQHPEAGWSANYPQTRERVLHSQPLVEGSRAAVVEAAGKIALLVENPRQPMPPGHRGHAPPAQDTNPAGRRTRRIIDMLDDQDEGARIGVWVALGVVALLLFGLVTGLAWRSIKPQPAAPGAAVSAAADAATGAAVAADAEDAVLDLPLNGDIIGRVYFDVGQSGLPADVAQPLADALTAVTNDRDKKLMLSGFHDPSGDPAMNAELAKNRAKAVREALKARGVAADRIVLRKPEQTAADGPAEEARRVEIRLIDLP